MTEKSSMPKLNNKNYEIWAVLTHALLTRKNLWDVASGNTPQPQTGPNSAAMRSWTRKNDEARAELILNVEVDQLAHMTDPRASDVWAELERIHRARGLASRLALRRRFLTMRVETGQTMSDWIAAVRGIAFQLRAIGVSVDDEDLILVLTMGLPHAYRTFVVALDSTPADDLTLDLVISRLLNEESRLAAETAEDAAVEEDAALAATYAPRRVVRRAPVPAATSQLAGAVPDLSHITCFTCGQKGHYQANCPLRTVTTALSPAVAARTATRTATGFAGAVYEEESDSDVAF